MNEVFQIILFLVFGILIGTEFVLFLILARKSVLLDDRDKKFHLFMAFGWGVSFVFWLILFIRSHIWELGK